MRQLISWIVIVMKEILCRGYELPTNCFAVFPRILKKILRKDQSKKQYAAQAKRRERLVGDVIGLCEGCEMMMENKPPLRALLGQCTGKESERYEKEFEKCLLNGIFYSTQEIRQAYIDIVGKNEIANWSRLVGVIFMGTQLSFVYSVGDTLIKWRSGSEDRSVKLIRDFLIKSDCIKRNIENPKYVNCVICGKGMSMVPKIVIGRRWGKIEEEEQLERFRASIAKDHINSHNLAKVFAAAYYVPMNKN